MSWTCINSNDVHQSIGFFSFHVFPGLASIEFTCSSIFTFKISKSKFPKADYYLDRVILVVGFLLFSCAVLYVVSKRTRILKLQRTVTAAIKVGMAGKGNIGLQPARDFLNLAQGHGNADPRMDMEMQILGWTCHWNSLCMMNTSRTTKFQCSQRRWMIMAKHIRGQEIYNVSGIIKS